MTILKKFLQHRTEFNSTNREYLRAKAIANVPKKRITERKNTSGTYLLIEGWSQIQINGHLKQHCSNFKLNTCRIDPDACTHHLLKFKARFWFNGTIEMLQTFVESHIFVSDKESEKWADEKEGLKLVLPLKGKLEGGGGVGLESSNQLPNRWQ